MPNTIYVVSDELVDKVCSYIRSGAFPEVACEACGIPVHVYRKWMQKANSKGSRKIFRQFRDAIIEASATARIYAEIAVFKDDPKTWLSKGPGRERHDMPGWTQPTRPILVRDADNASILASPEWNAVWSVVLLALDSFPDARQALIKHLEEKDQKKPKIVECSEKM
jgi:hypothetical protein